MQEALSDSKSTSDERKIHRKNVYIKIKNFALQSLPLRKTTQIENKYLQIIPLIKKLYPEYIKNPYNSVTKI